MLLIFFSFLNNSLYFFHFEKNCNLNFGKENHLRTEILIFKYFQKLPQKVIPFISV